jgi:hypothetical protein
VLIVDKGCRNAQTEALLAARGLRLPRPAYANEPPRPGAGLLKSIRQLIESVNDTSRASSTWSATAAGALKASPSASCSDCWQ